MNALSLLRFLNYGLVLLFGVFLSAHIAGGWDTSRQKYLIFALCPLSLLVQSLSCLIWSVGYTQKIYPLIVHLPLILALILVLKKTVGMAVAGVSIAYLCCQLPSWVSMAVFALTQSQLLAELSYTLIIFPFYYLLRRYFVPSAYATMTYSPQSLFLFCSLPVVYYLFDYATVIYSNALYAGIPMLTEFFPTALITFYILFLTAYHVQTQKQMDSDLQRSMLEAELEQSGAEIENLRHAEAQAAIYRHDLRHHLNAIDGFLSAGNPELAKSYIKQVCSDIESITPQRFCDHDLVNLLCSSFSARAKRVGVALVVHAKMPKQLIFPDTELCALLSNALENALYAVLSPDVREKRVDLYCELRGSKLLIEVKNPYAGKIVMKNGLPVSDRKGHGYGCQSILNITNRHRGVCSFDTNDRSEFVLRVVIPVQEIA